MPSFLEIEGAASFRKGHVCDPRSDVFFKEEDPYGSSQVGLGERWPSIFTSLTTRSSIEGIERENKASTADNIGRSDMYNIHFTMHEDNVKTPSKTK